MGRRSGGQGEDSRGRRKRLNRSDGISCPRNRTEPLELYRARECERSGKQENDGCDCRPFGMVTARHAAWRPGGRVVAAVHGVFGTGRRLPVVITVNLVIL